ncbi:MAG TPA: hypothetical protein PLL90_08340 [Bacteroidales bacterium]|nr:hypothetical protein [Bacteroidales bacterium]
MKKLALIGLVLLFSVVACNTTKTSKSGETEKKFVSVFLSYMNHEKAAQQNEMKACISPTYLKEQGIDITKYKVNNYAIWGYNIDYYSAVDGLVVAKIWGENENWVHQLEFKVVKESGKLYLMPSQLEGIYIDPWYKARLRIK